MIACTAAFAEPSTIKVDEDRVRDWLSKGAQPTEQVRKLLGERRQFLDFGLATPAEGSAQGGGHHGFASAVIGGLFGGRGHARFGAIDENRE